MKDTSRLSIVLSLTRTSTFTTPHDVEWAIATRFQADKNAVIFPNQPGSSLDPSGDLTEGKKATTCKMGLDATVPFGKTG